MSQFGSFQKTPERCNAKEAKSLYLCFQQFDSLFFATLCIRYLTPTKAWWKRFTPVGEGVRKSELRRLSRIRNAVAWALSSKIRSADHVTKAVTYWILRDVEEHECTYKRIVQSFLRKIERTIRCYSLPPSEYDVLEHFSMRLGCMETCFKPRSSSWSTGRLFLQLTLKLVMSAWKKDFQKM